MFRGKPNSRTFFPLFFVSVLVEVTGEMEGEDVHSLVEA